MTTHLPRAPLTLSKCRNAAHATSTHRIAPIGGGWVSPGVSRPHTPSAVPLLPGMSNTSEGGLCVPCGQSRGPR